MERHITQFKKILGDAGVETRPNELAQLGNDWTKVYEAKPGCALFPTSTEQVAAVLSYCNTENLAVVPSGGRTGLAGGAVASKGEVVVALTRMNKIEEVDTVGMTMRVEAGVTTQAMQEAAKKAGLFFALDLASKGSCQIGGNIATNAGGLKLIRYGGTREQILGLEVVLASGEVIDMNDSLRKNNTGYDLKQLFIGAEGTLGIVTRATVKLQPLPRAFKVAVMGCETFSDVTRILQVCGREGVQPTAFEFFTKVAHEIVLKYAAGARTPFAEKYAFYALVEVEEGPGGVNPLEGLLEALFHAGCIKDATMSESSTQFKDLWSLRENITESINSRGQVRKNDIALPIDKLDPFIADMDAVLKGVPADITIVLFGHLGDGNLHINYSGDRAIPKDDFQSRARAIEEKVFALLPKYGGTVSAEHGIGLVKKKDLLLSRSASEVAMMKSIKKVLDPKGIMNPGKIFDI